TAAENRRCGSREASDALRRLDRAKAQTAGAQSGSPAAAAPSAASGAAPTAMSVVSAPTAAQPPKKVSKIKKKHRRKQRHAAPPPDVPEGTRRLVAGRSHRSLAARRRLRRWAERGPARAPRRAGDRPRRLAWRHRAGAEARAPRQRRQPDPLRLRATRRRGDR